MMTKQSVVPIEHVEIKRLFLASAWFRPSYDQLVTGYICLWTVILETTD